MLDGIKLYIKGYRDNFSKGECYEKGLYVKPNFATALNFYRLAMNQGDPRGCFRMGQWYQAQEKIYRALIAYYKGAIANHEESRQSLETFIAEDNVEAIFLMGMVMERDSNWEKTIGLYNQAAKMEHPDAMFNLGNIYQRGVTGKVVIKANLGMALDWYRKAANGGSKHALNELVEMSEGNGAAALHLAEMYRLGHGGLHPNMERAIAIYVQASALGEPRASFYLGCLYEKGADGIEQNRPKAFKYYACSARQKYTKAKGYLEKLVISGDAEAQYAYGYYFYQKLNAITDAVRFCVMAEMQGHAAALVYLSKTKFATPIYLQIANQYESDQTNPRRNIVNAVKFYVKASEARESQATFRLAKLYENGSEGLTQNRPKAFAYYAFAARQGHADAKLHLETMAKTGDAHAQYEFGHNYHRIKGNLLDAVRWCVMAEMQDHKLALNYLIKTKFAKSTLLQIAQQYESDTINSRRNTARAIEFYRREVELGDKDTAFYLAQFYQIDHVGIMRNIISAFDFYVKAAKLGHQDVRAPLERLGEEVSAKKQIELSRIYQSFFRDEERATYWRDKAREVEELELKV